MTLCPLSKAVWPEFIEGPHITELLLKNLMTLQQVKKLHRLIVNMPPRHTKV